nr:hypothetical protein KXZ65_21135 [Pectobacterium sp. PL152]
MLKIYLTVSSGLIRQFPTNYPFADVFLGRQSRKEKAVHLARQAFRAISAFISDLSLTTVITRWRMGNVTVFKSQAALSVERNTADFIVFAGIS